MILYIKYTQKIDKILLILKKCKKEGYWREFFAEPLDERDSFLIFARRFEYCLLLCRAKIFGHRSQNNSLGCFAHCVRTPLSPPFRKRKNQPIAWFFFLAEREGFEPSCALAQTDFESVRLLGSYRTILPQSRLILVVVFQLLNASAIMSSLLDRWREGQTHWRYYSTKTPKNQGVLRK